MKVQSLTSINNSNIYYKNKGQKTVPVKPAQPSQAKPVSPATDSLKTAGIWLGFGLGFDYITKKCVIFKKSPVKNSLAVNGILAVLAGGVTFIKDSFSRGKG